MEKKQRNINHNLDSDADERATATACLFGETVIIKLKLSSHSNPKELLALNLQDDKQQQNCKRTLDICGNSRNHSNTGRLLETHRNNSQIVEDTCKPSQTQTNPRRHNEIQGRHLKKLINNWKASETLANTNNRKKFAGNAEGTKEEEYGQFIISVWINGVDFQF
jgi:hypothetical protein